MRNILDNMVDHYKDIHDNCEVESACRTDDNYEPSTITITTDIAENLLRNAIRQSTVYKKAQNYCQALGTSYVESFNNSLNIFQNKRIHFHNDHYEMRTDLAILYWNENVDRDFTSVYQPEQIPGEDFRASKKTYKPATFQFVNSLWQALMATQDWNEWYH